MNNRTKNLKLDLQMFATASTQNQNATSASGMSAEMKTFYEKRLIDQAEPALVHDQFGDPYPIPANGGKNIEFRKYDSLPKATTPLTEGVTPDGQTMNVSTVTAEVKQYGGWVPITDTLQLTAIDNNIVQATKIIASQAGRTLDTIVRDVLAGGTNVIYAPKIGEGGAETPVTSRATLDATCQLTSDLIARAATQLKAMNADPIGTSFVGIIHPYVAYELRRDPDWIDVHKYAQPDEIYNGEIGTLHGVRFVETSEAKIWKGTGCPAGLAVFSTLILGAHAYGSTEIEGGGLEHIVKQLGYGDDPLNQRASVGWKAHKTAERLVEQYMVRIESCSARYSATAEAN
jgi:N4-gp56 family major capsid protein|nr:MAG: coat protein [Bacteriophage sp.]DAX00143.1 MAG TPA: major capsid protein [Caudoviricetes sp.]